MTPLSGLLILLTMLLQQLTVREEGLVGQLGLILLPDPIPSLMVLHSMLQDHYFEHFLGRGMGKF